MPRQKQPEIPQDILNMSFEQAAEEEKAQYAAFDNLIAVRDAAQDAVTAWRLRVDALTRHRLLLLQKMAGDK